MDSPVRRFTPSPRALLLLVAALTLIAWQLPYGQVVLYPFTLLATYAHEMGHGVASLLVGGEFESLVIYPDGSGLARWRGDVGRLGRALVAVGGLVGPSVVGAFVLVWSTRVRRPAVLLLLLAAVVLGSVLFVGRSLFTVVFLLAVLAVLLAVARFAPSGGALFLAQLTGVQLCLSVFKDLSYMFSKGGVVGGQAQLSDTGAIEELLILPYWFWGGCVAVLSFGILVLGLWISLSSSPSPRKAPGRAP